jgi:hypothetical protein
MRIDHPRQDGAAGKRQLRRLLSRCRRWCLTLEAAKDTIVVDHQCRVLHDRAGAIDQPVGP